MNHDHDNFSGDDGLPVVTPELEARLSAWIAGELSTAERAEFERLVQASPALAEFRARMEATRNLVVEALRDEPAPLRLSDDRRAALLQVLASTPAAAPLPEKPSVVTRPAPWWRGRYRQVYFSAAGLAAACLVAGIFIVREYAAPKPARSVAAASAQRRVESLPRQAKAREESLKVALPALQETPADTGRSEDRDTVVAQTLAPSMPVPLSPTEMQKGLAKPNLELNAPLGRSLSADLKVAVPPVVLPPITTTTTAGARAAASSTDTGYLVQDAELKSAAKDAVAPGTYAGAGRAAFVGGKQEQFADRLAPPPSARLLEPTPKLETLSLNSGTRRTDSVNFGQVSPVTLGASASSNAERDGLTEAAGSVGGTLTTAGASAVAKEARVDLPAVAGAGGAAVPENEVLTLSAFTVAGPPKTPTRVAKKAAAKLADAAGARPADVPATTPAAIVSLEEKAKLDQPVVRAAPIAVPVRAETSADVEPFSTFSLHVSDVSFRLAHAALARGEMPAADRVRPEEFYNAFTYGDLAPTLAEKVGARIEQAAHPFLQQRNLVRIALKVPSSGRTAATPLRLTVLLDTSGSMEREDRVAIVRRALAVLVSLLGPNDRITLVGFARQPRLLAEAVAGDQAGQLVDLVARIPAEGGTDLEAALKLGGDLAGRHQTAGAQNRLVVLTDGAANLGNADPAQLANLITILRQRGIAFDACGVGLDGLDDAVLAALTRQGDGRYYALNSAAEADAGFARQLAGAFRPAAENVKLQVRFNAGRVGRYRLIGFEEHRLRTEDFRNDQVDAAELAADEGANAVYQVEVLPEGTGEIGEVFVRFRDPATAQMVERSWTIPFEAGAPAFARATPTLQLAGTAALLAEKLQGGSAADQIRLRELQPVVDQLATRFAHDPRVVDLAAMFQQLRRLGPP
jgi:Ca-activated chloride channel homolog